MIINNIAQQIGQDPSNFISKQKEILFLTENQKKSYFQQLQKTPSIIENSVLQEFMKQFKTYQIIFKPKKIQPKNQHMLFQSDTIFHRSLNTKLYPAKNQSIHSQNQSQPSDDLNEENFQDFQNSDRMIYQNQQIIKKEQKKFIVKKKREQKDLTKIAMPQAGESWKRSENLKLLVFLMKFKRYFSKKSKGERDGLFIKMANYIGTRNAKKCSQNFEGQEEKFKDIDSIIKSLQSSVNFTDEEINRQIVEIDELFQKIVQRECNALHRIKLQSEKFKSGSNFKIIKSIISKEVEKINKIHSQKQMNSQQSYIKVPFAFNVTLVQEQSQAKIYPNQSKMQEENHDYANQNYNNFTQKIYNVKPNQSSNQGFKPYIANQRKKLKKKRQNWSASEDLKVVSYFLVNPHLINYSEQKSLRGFFPHMSEFIHTQKTSTQCKDHLLKWKSSQKESLNASKIAQKVIQIQSLRFGITTQMIQERKKISMEMSNFSVKIGSTTLELDYLPQILKFKKSDFNIEYLIERFCDSEPYFSFYLNFRDQSMIQEQQQREKNIQKQQNQIDSEEVDLVLGVKLEMKKQVFEKLKDDLTTELLCQTCRNFKLFENKIQVPIKFMRLFKLVIQNLYIINLIIYINYKPYFLYQLFKKILF